MADHTSGTQVDEPSHTEAALTSSDVLVSLESRRWTVQNMRICRQVSISRLTARFDADRGESVRVVELPPIGR